MIARDGTMPAYDSLDTSSVMELPIFNDNLKSSGSWAAQLAREQEAWGQAPRDRAEPRMRELQVEHALGRAGQGIDARRLLTAARMVSSWARDAEAEFTLDRLHSLHRALIGAAAEEDVLRKTEALPMVAMHDPAPALIVQRMLDNAFDWFSTDSFRELHPVERAAVVYLRLLDLHPFPAHTETTALMAASFYTERAGLPPLVIFADEVTQVRYQQALEAAFRMLTQPLVEFFAEMLRRTMSLARGEAQ
ncbi:MAG: Fic family protein [Blastocatellia bacterium]